MSDIGSAGEHFFMGFCFADGVNANKCGADKNGWDVIVEVDQDPRQLSQHTLHEPIITAKVQVKSTRKKSLKVDVTLSNLRKMATSPLPTFYVLLDFSEGAPPRRAFLRHMNEALIKETLERVNALLVEGNAQKLHKSTMRVDFEQGREIALNDSDTFKRAVLDAVGRSASGYADRKSAFLRDVGTSDGSHLLRFEIQGIESLTALVNATLGMGGTIPLHSMQMSSKRFGMEDPGSRSMNEGGLIELGPIAPTAQGTLTFRNPATGASTQVAALAYMSPLHHALPKHLRRIRFDCGMFDWLINEDGSNAQFQTTLDPNQPVLLDDLCNFLQVMSLIHEPENLIVEVDLPGFHHSATIRNGTGVMNFSSLLEAADLLAKTKAFFQDRGALEVSVTDLLQLHTEVRGLTAYLHKEATLDLKFVIDEQPDLNEATCLVPLSLKVGTRYYIAVVAVSGKLGRAEDGRYHVFSSHYEILYKTVLRAQELSREKVLQQIEVLTERYAAPLPIVNLIPVMLNLDSPA
ncbi:MAG: hypothetical protein ACN6PW_02650 [Pseudomonas kermanshahensis]|uniref:hypothetical protein n=1 Tax=Pseudomonas kermanshahensis TaxID=2745482 RepID=UPI003D116F5F